MLRITFVIGFTLVASAVVLTLASNWFIREARLDSERDHHQALAAVAAAHVEDVLTRTAEREDHLARMVATAWTEGESEATALLDVYPKFLFESDLHLIRPQGEVVWSMNAVTSPPALPPSEAAAVIAARSLTSTISMCSSQSSIGLACIASPVIGGDGSLLGVLLAEIDLKSRPVDLLSLDTLNDDFVITLMTEDGVVLASNDPSISSSGRDVEEIAAGSVMAPVNLVPGWTIALEPKASTGAPFWTTEGSELVGVTLMIVSVALIGIWMTTRGTRHPVISVPMGSMRRLPDALVRRHGQERQRLSRELGEQAAQSLAALAMTLDDLEGRAISNPEDLPDRIAGARLSALKVMSQLRSLATRLHPPVLDDFGLEPALRSLAKGQLAGKGMQVEVTSSGTGSKPDPLVESVLFRAAQELIDNIDKHSQATTVCIAVHRSAEQITLTVEDDGLGLDLSPSTTDTGWHTGLGNATVRQLVTSVGGTMTVQSQRSRGMRIVITIPSEPSSDA